MTATVVAGFGVCLVGVVGLLASAMRSTYDHDRGVVENALVATARSQYIDDGSYVLPFLEGLAAEPSLAEFQAESCAHTLLPFAGVTGDYRALVLDPDGGVVCSLPADVVDPLPDEITAGVLSGRPTASDVFVDDITGQPAVASAMPITAADGRSGAIAVVRLTGSPALAVPTAVDPSTVVLVLDPARRTVVATTKGAPYPLGSPVAGTHFADGLGGRSRTVVDADGVRRIWREVADPESGWPVLAGLDADVALAGAHEQRRSLLLVGAGVVALMVSLAVALQRRLARPVRRLGEVIAASRAGDRGARARVAGPVEVAEVAAAFNELVDAQQALEDRLRGWATQDALTGLPNRRAVTEALDAALADPAAAPVAVLFVDLDRFKLVNDSHGHVVGDELLVALAARLVDAAGEGCIVSRFGGDEFVIVCRGCEDPVPEAERIDAILRSPVEVEGHPFVVGGSIGIAKARGGEAAGDLLREADTAMYRAKDAGRGGHAVFDDEMRAWTVARLSTERDLRGAADRGELRLHLQPIIDLPTGRVVAAEALVRWQHPERGLLGPAEFIPVAEETGLIGPIGTWVLEAAVRQAVSWRHLLGRAMPVSVNVAARQLADGGLVTAVMGALDRAGGEPTDLCLEVTETAVLTDIDMAIEQLASLRRLGIRVALDDFGTGYSSLTYLQRLPASELKIDRSFVAAVGIDPVSTAIVSSVVDLAHAVGLSVVAEGVEHEQQLVTLDRLGCDRAQGFHIAVPAPAADLDLGRRHVNGVTAGV